MRGDSEASAFVPPHSPDNSGHCRTRGLCPILCLPSFKSGSERGALRFHPNVGIVLDHFPADVTSDSHEGVFACLRLRQLGNARVTVMPTSA
jgi:hypothetical protein